MQLKLVAFLETENKEEIFIQPVVQVKNLL